MQFLSPSQPVRLTAPSSEGAKADPCNDSISEVFFQ